MSPRQNYSNVFETNRPKTKMLLDIASDNFLSNFINWVAYGTAWIICQHLGRVPVGGEIFSGGGLTENPQALALNPFAPEKS